MQYAQSPQKKFYLLFREVRRILEIHHSGNASVVKIFKRTFRPTNLEFTSSDEIESYIEDKSYVDDGDEEIATLQTEYFLKPCQNPVFSDMENTENDFEESSSREALLQTAVPSASIKHVRSRGFPPRLLSFYSPYLFAVFYSL